MHRHLVLKVMSAGRDFSALRGSGQQKRFDIVITHGRIIDGTGSPSYPGDAEIRDGQIGLAVNPDPLAALDH